MEVEGPSGQEDSNQDGLRSPESLSRKKYLEPSDSGCPRIGWTGTQVHWQPVRSHSSADSGGMGMKKDSRGMLEGQLQTALQYGA